MRVLLLHNRYRQLGGEDAVVHQEHELLTRNGIDVRLFETNNDGSALRAGLNAAWSWPSYRSIRSTCRDFRPHIAHTHNFWMNLSPSVHAACHAEGVPTVQTLHNFRLLCANALFLRDDKSCEDCLGVLPWRGVVRKCYRKSLLASASVAAMISANRLIGTWRRHVDAFVTPSDHTASKFISAGMDSGRIFTKPNFIVDPHISAPPPSSSQLLLYSGRLSPEKGVNTLLSAWAQVPEGLGQLIIAGEGPERRVLEFSAAELGLRPPRVIFVGQRSAEEISRRLVESRAVIVPSVCYETGSRSVVEAYAAGRPTIASKLGSLAEMVLDTHTGLTFEPGDASALAKAMEAVLRDGDLADLLGRTARARYEALYSPDRNFETLMRIYRFAVQRHGSTVPDVLARFQPAEATTV